MAISAYRSNSSRRIFTNYPFPKGMISSKLVLQEGHVRKLINFDISSDGSHVSPRPSFVNSVIHDGISLIDFPNKVIKQETSRDKTFIIGFDHTVNKEDYLNDVIHQQEDKGNQFGITTGAFHSDVVEFERAVGTLSATLEEVVDGDTIRVTFGFETYQRAVRPIGYDSPEAGEAGFEEDTIALKRILYNLGEEIADEDIDTTISDAGLRPNVYLIFEPNTTIKDIYGRLLCYIVADDGEGDYPYRLVNTHMLMKGSEHTTIAYLSSNFRYYTEMNEANDAQEYNSLLVNFLDNHSFKDEEYEESRYFKKQINTGSAINNKINDTVSYYQTDEELDGADLETDLFDTTQDLYVEILEHAYEDHRYESTSVQQQLPHTNMPWRNAIAFFGRVVNPIEPEVLYRGLMVLQYYPEEDQHYLLVVKPYQIHVGAFNIEDPTSIAYNAWDSSPHIFQDYIHDDAIEFSRPSILGVLIYDRYFDGSTDDNPRLVSDTDPFDKLYVRPYVALPEINDPDYRGTFLRIRTVEDDDPDWEMIQSANNVVLTDVESLCTIMFDDGSSDMLHYNEEGGESTCDDKETHETGVTTTYDDTFDSENFLRPIMYKRFNLSKQNNTPVIAELKSVIDRGLKDPEYVSTSQDFSDDFKENFSYTYEGNNDKYIDNFYEIDLKIITRLTQWAAIYRVLLKITNTGTSEEVYSKEFDLTVPHTTDTDVSDVRLNLDIPVEDFNINCTIKLYAGDEESDTDRHKLKYHEELNTELENRFVYTVNLQYDVEEWFSTGATQPINARGHRTVDPEDLLKNHDLWNATQMTKLDRYLILYGESIGSNTLQFLEFDHISHAPFPNHNIYFDSKIVHVHHHRGALYVFCEEGLWILHSGMSPIDMIKTFAHAGTRISPSEKSSVISYGNEVFYMHENKGYAIRTNVNVESQDDVYVQPVTGPIDELLYAPREHVKQRLEEGYGVMVKDSYDLYSAPYVHSSGSELYIIMSYHIGNPIERIMITYIFDRDTKRWRSYDTLSGSFPLFHLSSGNIKGFDLVMANHYHNPKITFGSYLYRLPTNFKEYAIGDANAFVFDEEEEEWIFFKDHEDLTYALLPIQCMIDSGSLAFNQAHIKRIRRLFLGIMDIEEQEFHYYIVPYTDGLDYQNKIEVTAVLDEDNNVVAEFDHQLNDFGVSQILPVVSPQSMHQNIFKIRIKEHQSNRRLKLAMFINMRGKLPGFRLYKPSTDTFKISDYGIVFRQMKAR